VKKGARWRLEGEKRLTLPAKRVLPSWSPGGGGGKGGGKREHARFGGHFVAGGEKVRWGDGMPVTILQGGNLILV